MSFSRLNKIIKANKKLKEKQVKEKLNEIANEKEDEANKIHMPGIGYKQKQIKSTKNINTININTKITFKYMSNNSEEKRLKD